MKNIDTFRILTPEHLLRDTAKLHPYPGQGSLLTEEITTSHAGVLVWNCLENRLFISEGFCRMMEITKNAIINFETFIRHHPAIEFRNYIKEIEECIACNDDEELTFKLILPGNNKKIHGCIQMIDLKWPEILDIVVLCFED